MKDADFRTSLRELGWLGWFFFLSALVWIALIGWRPGLYPFYNDGLVYSYPALAHAARFALLPDYLLYDPGLLGGGKPVAAFTSPAFVRGLFRLGLSRDSLFLAFGLFTQVFFGFFVERCARLFFAAGKGQERIASEILARSSTFLLAAFAPILAWKSATGHFLYPLIFFPALLTAYLALARKEMNTGLFLLCAAALWTSFQTLTLFIFVYGVIFGAPLALALYFFLPQPKGNDWLVLALLGAAGLIGAAPFVFDATWHFWGTDAGRALSDDKMVYAYNTGRWRDWAASLFWTFQLPGYRVTANIAHEVHHAFGPLLPLAVALLWGKARWAAAALGLAFVGGISLANNVSPLSTMLLKAFPILLTFRVPTRVGPVLFTFLAVLALAELVRRVRREPGTISRGQGVAAGLLALALFFLPPLARELAAWAFVALILFWERPAIKKALAPVAAPVTLLALFAALSVFSFRDRYVFPVHDLRETTARTESLREAIVALDPSVLDPLNRIEFLAEDRKFETNTVRVLGLPTLKAYTMPLRRYAVLLSELYGVPYDPQFIFWRTDYNELTRPVFYLYNVRRAIGIEDGRAKRLAEWPAAGRAWLGRRVELVPSLRAVADRLRAISPASYGSRLRDEVLVATDDAKFSRGLTAGPTCAGRSLEHLSETGLNFSLEAALSEGGECLLVVSTNYAENIAVEDAVTGAALETVPVYGAMLGVLVPKETTKLRLGAVSGLSELGRWALLCSSLALFGAAFALYRRRSSTK